MGEMINEFVVARPAAPLRRWVREYHGYRQCGVEPAVHQGLPSPYLTLIFTLDEPIRLIRHVDPTQPGGTFRAIVGGLHTTSALIGHQGSQSGIQLQLSPLGARALLKLPAGELTGIDLPAADVLGPVAGEVQERLATALTWPERFAVLDRALTAALIDAEPDPMVGYAWNRLTATGGRLPIGFLAREIGCSSRYLRKRFDTDIGLSPKTAAAVIRFDGARRALPTAATISTAAAAFGYYDHAHFVRDFHRFAGSTPSEWLAQEFRNVQAGNPDAVSPLSS